jgi:rubrerythrin
MPIGRPTKLTPDLQRQVCDTLRRGAYLETAAALAGVDRTTLQEWLRRGRREDDGPYVEFSRAVQSAQAEAEMRDLDRVDAAAEAGTWQASAWRLERRSPERWGRRTSVKLEAPAEGDDDAPMPGFRAVELTRCPKCGSGTYADDAPKFCAACGSPLRSEAALHAEKRLLLREHRAALAVRRGARSHRVA